MATCSRFDLVVLTLLFPRARSYGLAYSSRRVSNDPTARPLLRCLSLSPSLSSFLDQQGLVSVIQRRHQSYGLLLPPAHAAVIGSARQGGARTGWDQASAGQKNLRLHYMSLRAPRKSRDSPSRPDIEARQWTAFQRQQGGVRKRSGCLRSTKKKQISRTNVVHVARKGRGAITTGINI